MSEILTRASANTHVLTETITFPAGTELRLDETGGLLAFNARGLMILSLSEKAALEQGMIAPLKRKPHLRAV